MQQLSPARWQEIDALFERALEQPPAERAVWIEAASSHDPELHCSVLQLLESASTAESALGESVSDFAEPLLDELEAHLECEELPGLASNGRVGPYRVVREIGRGGMGTVYLAERADAEFHKQVALKLVKRGMDTDEVLRRFRYERQILASLEHPHIARLYDGGATQDGRPYLVMEYIEGQSITTYCDERRLCISARLRLFTAVCRAVQFAHRNLVVHRDIKPSNVLVTADGSVKLLDFGIAKLLDSPSTDLRTRTELRLHTPEYAAPEQIRGAPVTTASDVYALGALLYELLVGRRPDAVSNPARPSSAVSRIQVGSAGAEQSTAPEIIASRRDTTPQRLRRDLEGDLNTIVLRALAEEPARRYPSAEHLLIDIERHFTGLPVAARGDSVAYRMAKFVRRNRVGVLAASFAVLSLIGGLGAALWQAQAAASERDAARQERARAEQVSSFLLSLFEAADSYHHEDSDTLRVRDLVDRGAARVRDELTGQPRLQAQMLTTLGRVYTNVGAYTPAQAVLEEALKVSSDAGYARERALALAALAQVHDWRGEYALADSLYEEVMTLHETHRWPADALFIGTLSERALALSKLGRDDEAATLHQRAVQLLDSENIAKGRLYADVLNNLGTHLAALDEYAQAERLLREALDIDRNISKPDHPSVVAVLNNIARSIHYQGRYDEAEEFYLEAIAIARRAYGDDHPHVGKFLDNLATLHDDRGAHREAEPLYREALRINTAALGPRSTHVAMLQRNFALNRHAVGELSEAESLLREATATLQTKLGAEHLYTALAHASLGRILSAAGEHTQALHLLRGALTMLERQLPARQWRIHAVRSDLGAALTARGDLSEAEPLLLDSYAALRVQKGDDDYSTVDARTHLRRLYTAWGQLERAQLYGADAVRIAPTVAQSGLQ